MSSKVAKFEEYARKQKEKKRIEEELIELRIENNNLKKEVEKYKEKYQILKEEVVRERLKELGLIE
jgi:hypothetical protein